MKPLTKYKGKNRNKNFGINVHNHLGDAVLMTSLHDVMLTRNSKHFKSKILCQVENI